MSEGTGMKLMHLCERTEEYKAGRIGIEETRMIYVWEGGDSSIWQQSMPHHNGAIETLPLHASSSSFPSPSQDFLFFPSSGFFLFIFSSPLDFFDGGRHSRPGCPSTPFPPFQFLCPTSLFQLMQIFLLFSITAFRASQFLRRPS